MRRHLLGLGIASLAVAAAPAAADMPSLEPVPLFTAVCTQGTARLPAGEVARAAYRDLPEDARVALGFGLPSGHGMATGMMQPLESRDVPNAVLAIGRGKERYLVPTATEGHGALATSCAVVWRGRHFAEARAAATEIAGTGDVTDDASPVVGAHLFGARGGGFEVVASEISGWTVLRLTTQPAIDIPAARASTVASPGMTVRDNGKGEVVVKSGGNQ